MGTSVLQNLRRIHHAGGDGGVVGGRMFNVEYRMMTAGTRYASWATFQEFGPPRAGKGP